MSPGCCYLCSSFLLLQAASPGTSHKAAVPKLRVIDFCFFHSLPDVCYMMGLHLAFSPVIKPKMLKERFFNDPQISSTKAPPRPPLCRSLHQFTWAKSSTKCCPGSIFLTGLIILAFLNDLHVVEANRRSLATELKAIRLSRSSAPSFLKP